MAKYTFVVAATISMHVVVEADSIEAAADAARDAPVMGLCHQCAKGCGECDEPEWCTSGEFDFDPTGSELIEVFAGNEDVDLSEVKW